MCWLTVLVDVLICHRLNPYGFFVPKIALKGVRIPMSFPPQSAGRPPPIVFPLRGMRAAERPYFSRKQTLFLTVERR